MPHDTSKALPDRSSPEVVERFAKFVCPTRCGGSAVEISEGAGRVWICGMCHEDAVSAEFVTLDASDFDRLRAENERLRASILAAKTRLESIPISPRLLIAIDGLDAALDPAPASDEKEACTLCHGRPLFNGAVDDTAPVVCPRCTASRDSQETT